MNTPASTFCLFSIDSLAYCCARLFADNKILRPPPTCKTHPGLNDFSKKTCSTPRNNHAGTLPSTNDNSPGSPHLTTQLETLPRPTMTVKDRSGQQKVFATETRATATVENIHYCCLSAHHHVCLCMLVYDLSPAAAQVQSPTASKCMPSDYFHLTRLPLLWV